jgi:hypothetical protein
MLGLSPDGDVGSTSPGQPVIHGLREGGQGCGKEVSQEGDRHEHHG